MRNLDSMALKGSEVCGVSVCLAQGGHLEKGVFDVVGPFAAGQARGAR